MRKTCIASLAFLACAASAQSTVDLLLFNFASREVDGSVIGSDATATTYSLSCPTAANGQQKDIECNFGPNFRLTQGPSTVNYKASVLPYSNYDDASSAYSTSVFPLYYTVYELGCALTGTTSALCIPTVIRPGPSTAIGEPTHIEEDNFATNTDGMGAIPVTITAGAAASATSVVASTTTMATSGSTASSSTSSGSGSTSVASTSGSVALVTGTSTSTGGLAMITGNAKLVVGAAAAGLVLAGL